MKLQQLKEIAAKLNYTYKGNLGAVKLESALRTYCEENNLSFDEMVQENDMSEDVKDTEVEETTPITFVTLEANKPVTQTKSKTEVQREALKLVRCIVTCNNRNKTSYTGEIFSVCNAAIPEVKKFIQFGVPYHVPQIILNAIQEKKMHVFRKVRNNDGSFKTVANEAPEYNVQLLDPISEEELEAIKKKQLAEGLNNEE